LSADAMRDAPSETEDRLSHARSPVASKSRIAACIVRNPRARVARDALTGPLFGRRRARSLRRA
jgi:hypothetical protein